jgi:hypothetical protein
MPSRQYLMNVATNRYWIEKGRDMVENPHTDLLLQWPLPACMHFMYRTIDEIVSEWEEKVLSITNQGQRDHQQEDLI